jgi:hypothetical protein
MVTMTGVAARSMATTRKSTMERGMVSPPAPS